MPDEQKKVQNQSKTGKNAVPQAGEQAPAGAALSGVVPIKKKRRRRRRKKPSVGGAEAASSAKKNIQTKDVPKEVEFAEPAAELDEEKKEASVIVSEPIPKPEPELEIETEAVPLPEPEPEPAPESELEPEPEPAPEIENATVTTKEEEPESIPAPELPQEQQPISYDDDIVFDDEKNDDQPIPIGKVYEDVEIFPKNESPVEPEPAQVTVKESVPPPAPIPEKAKEVITSHGQQEVRSVQEQEPAHEYDDDLPENQAFMDKFLDSLKEGMQKIGDALRNMKLIKAKSLTAILIFGVIIGGVYYGYTQKYHESVVNYIAGFFKEKTVIKTDVTINEDELREWGIVTASIFAANEGSIDDFTPVQIKIADFFGNLREPKVSGETGISAASFYGELKDDKAVVNQFVVYLEYLGKLQSLYKIDVYAMLDRTSERATGLLDYLAKLKTARIEGQTLLDQMKVNMDEFKISYDSLTADKTKNEKDFFTAMDSLEAEKSDLLLKGFIDVSQKQIALKARVSALAKLVTYYEAAIKKLDIRILAIEQNKDALIQGIRVVDIPGAALDIIIKPGA